MPRTHTSSGDAGSTTRGSSRDRASGRAGRLSDRAFLLRRTPFGESSLIVHALTRTHGRVQLIAKGAHRPKSRYVGVLDLFDTLELGWSTGRNTDLGTLREGALSVRRRGLTRSLAAYRSASTVVELLDIATRAGAADDSLFQLGEQALDALDAAETGHAAVLAGFELHLLDQLGLAPALGTCASCGGPAGVVDPRAAEPRVPFSATAGGRLCAKHANEAHSAGVRVGTLPEAILVAAGVALRSPLDGPDPAARSHDLAAWPPDLAERVLDFAGRFLDHHLETRPKSHATFLSAPDRNRSAARTRHP